MNIYDNFAEVINPFWRVDSVGQASVIRRPNALSFALIPDENAQRQDARLKDSTEGLSTPTQLTAEAFSSLHPANYKGTLGIGLLGDGLANALAFVFVSPESALFPQAKHSHGFFAACIISERVLPSWLTWLAPVLKRVPFLFRVLAPLQRRVEARALDPDLLNAQHTYRIVWRANGAQFFVDGESVHYVDNVPTVPLHVTAWANNDTLHAQPDGTLSISTVAITRPQSLVLTSIALDDNASEAVAP
jgi:hypothetical protein